MSRKSFALLTLFSTLITFIAPLIARAEQWDKETVVTFNSPIEVPGKVLPRGTYVFKLASSQSDRQLVQILTQDQRQVLASIQAIPDYRLHPTDKAVISLQERPSGHPEALQSWFYPGDSYGVQFVYSESPIEVPANPDADVAANAKSSATAPPLANAIAPPLSQLITSPVAPIPGGPKPKRQVLADNTELHPMQAQLATLPKTARNSIILPLIGVLFLCCGSTILYTARQRRVAQ